MTFAAVASRASNVQATDATTHAITLPAGVAVGDLLVVVFSADGSPTCTQSAGWNKLGQASNTTTVTGAVFWKVATGSDALTVTTSVAEQSTHISLRITGSAGTLVGTSSNGNSTNSDPPLHAVAFLADVLWIATRSADTSVAANHNATAAPAGFSNFTTQDATTTTGASTSTAELAAAAASQNPGTFTSATEQWVSWTLAVTPAPIPVAATTTGTGQITVAAPSQGQQVAASTVGAGQVVVTGGTVGPGVRLTGAGQVAVAATRVVTPTFTVRGNGAVTSTAFATKFPTFTVRGNGVFAPGAEVVTPPRPDVAIGGATPHVAFWAVNRTTGALAPLPHVTGFDLSPVRNGVGSIRIDYPAFGTNYNLLRAIVDQDVQLEVEIWIGGSANGRMRGLLLEAAGDDVAEDGSWTFAGHFLEYRAHDAVVAPDATPGNDWETFFDNASPGVVMKTLWQAAQARGTLTDISTSTFSTTLDSNGVPWSQAVYMSFAPHRHYDEVLDDLVEAGVCEWEITPDHQLRLYEPGSRGDDLTLGAPPMILRRGRNLREAQRKFSSRDAGTDLWAAGGEGLYDKFSDATARARLGRQVERAISANSIIDEGALSAYIQNKIGEITRGALELTLEIVFGAGQPLPRSGINVGDWLWTDTGRGTASSSGLEYYRVSQWTLTSDGDELRGTFSLNDLMSERISRVEKLLKAVAGGTVVVGTSVATPDAKEPHAPTGLGASSLAYVDDEGKTYAAVTASWQAVTTNADNTALDDLSGYRIRYRYVTGGPAGTFDAGRVSSLFTSHVFSGVIAGATIAIQVQAYDRTELESAWTAELLHLAASDSTAPPVPAAPTVTSDLGVVTVAWNGLGQFGEQMPADFSHVDILWSTVADFTLGDGQYLDRLMAAGATAASIGGYGTTVYVKMRSVDRSGNPSALSTQATVFIERALADDIADDIITAAKIADGAVTTPAIAPKAITTPHLSVAAFSDNLAPNGGFEDVSLTDPTLPAGWTVTAGSGAVTALRDTTAANVDSGSASLKVSLSAASGRAEVGSDSMPVRPGDLVVLQARAKASRAVAGFRWRIFVYASDPATFSGSFQFNSFNLGALTTSFTTIEQQFTVPAVLTVGSQAGQTPRFIRVVPCAGDVVGDEAPLDAWFDEVRVRTVVGTAEIADAAIQRAKIANLAVGDAQIENASFGKLTAGTLSATVLLSGLIRTATTGARSEIDAAGIRLYNSAGTATVNLNASTGVAFMSGTVESGTTATDRVVVQPSGAGASGVALPEISFYAATTRPGYINAVAATDGTLLGMNSGRSGNVAGALQTTLKLFPRQFDLNVNTAPYPTADAAGSARGGRVIGDTTRASMEFWNSSGTYRVGYHADTNGLVMDGPGAPQIQISSTETTLISAANSFISVTTTGINMNDGGVGKTFVIPHPQDDPADPQRYLIHACLEGPDAGAIYRGTATVEDQLAVVQLPAYFEALTTDDRQVIVQPVLATRGGRALVCPAAASEVKGGGFHIVCPGAPDGSKAHWVVFATRKNTTFQVEPRRDDVVVTGTGPYLTATPKGS